MRWRGLAFAWLAIAAVGCGEKLAPTLTLATTTSVQDTGLLDVLLPAFRERAGIDVRAVSVGSGQALELGRRGDADVLLVHDPDGEQRFVEAGFAESRDTVMRNDFVIVGPPEDPADVRGVGAATEAFARIERANARFVSRGDESGTHRQEQRLWRTAGVEPVSEWYVRAEAGMAQALRMAGEKRAYTLVDQATFRVVGSASKLESLVAGYPEMANEYRVIVVHLAKHPHVQAEAARRFARFLTSVESQRLIADFGTERFGLPLFTPVVGP